MTGQIWIMVNIVDKALIRIHSFSPGPMLLQQLREKLSTASEIQFPSSWGVTDVYQMIGNERPNHSWELFKICYFSRKTEGKYFNEESIFVEE